MPSNFEAFRYQDITPNGPSFARAFLSSYDFDQFSLKDICRKIGVQVSGGKNTLAERIVGRLEQDPRIADLIMSQLVKRTRTAFALRYVGVLPRPRASDPILLVENRGEANWYGPLLRSDDAEGTYYIHPLFFPYSEKSEDETMIEPIEYKIRWLVFARVGNGILSLHWHGFTYQNQNHINNPRSRSQFAYWREIPRLFESMSELLSRPTTNVKHHTLILDTVIERYRRNPDYDWSDDRIRAEAGNVALNVRAGASQPTDGMDDETEVSDDVPDINGVVYLATTIRKAIQRKLINNYDFELPDPAEFDEEIMITLIKKFGSQSYGLRVTERPQGFRFHAHCYFGSKPDSNTPDRFPHFQLKHTSELPDLTQLRFLISNFDPEKHVEDT